MPPAKKPVKAATATAAAKSVKKPTTKKPAPKPVKVTAKKPAGVSVLRTVFAQGTPFQKCVRFCAAMNWHLQFTPDVNSFRSNAYKVAGEALSAHGTLNGIGAVTGIGKAMLASFRAVEAGELPEQLLEIADNGPPFTVSELTRIPGVGPKTALKLHEAYGVASLAELEKKIQSHEVTDPKLIQGFFDMSSVNDRIPRQSVLVEVEAVLNGVRKITEAAVAHDTEQREANKLKSTPRYRGRVMLAGSIRRQRPDIRDIDVMVEVPEHKPNIVIDAVTKHLKTIAPVNVTNKGGHKKAEIQIEVGGRKRKLDVNFLQTHQWGTAVLHFTGPMEYNVRVRKHAVAKGLSVSQYAITKTGVDGKPDKHKHFTTEKAALEYLGLPYLAPELRDHVASITEAPKGIVKQKHVFADLHFHTTDSDGLLSNEDAAAYFSTTELRLLGISNHSAGTGRGLDESVLAKHVSSLRKRLNSRKVIAPNQRVLIGTEVDINADGELAYSDDVLRKLDYMIVSIHHRLDYKTTERYLAAIKKAASLGIPAAIAHITGRIIGHRPGAEADYDSVLAAAAMAGVAIEINGQYDRCDCPTDLVLRAMKHGCYFLLSSDYHGRKPGSEHKALLENAVMQARRAHMPRNRIVNADENAMTAWFRFREMF